MTDEAAVERVELQRLQQRVLEAEIARLRREVSDLRGAVIQVVASADLRRDYARDMWAIRSVANDTSKPFNWEDVEAKVRELRRDDTRPEVAGAPDARPMKAYAAGLEHAARLRESRAAGRLLDVDLIANAYAHGYFRALDDVSGPLVGHERGSCEEKLWNIVNAAEAEANGPAVASSEVAL